mgnify:CR=1 FL=1
MNKIWFVFQRDHHIGPYSQEEIGKLFVEGRVGGQSLLWREGLAEWLYLKDIPEFLELLKSKEELPPEIHPDDIPLPSDENKKFDLLEKLDNYDNLDSLTSNSGQQRGWIKWLLGIFSLGIVFASLFLFLSKMFYRPDLVGLSEVDIASLKSTVSQKGALQFNFALTSDGNHIWMASNYDGNANISLRLISEKERILSAGEVIITANLSLRNHYGKISKFKIESGGGLIPGFYSILVEGIKTGAWAKILHFIKRVKILSFVDWIDNYSVSFRGKGIFLLSAEERSKFDEKLSRFQNEIGRASCRERV